MKNTTFKIKNKFMWRIIFFILITIYISVAVYGQNHIVIDNYKAEFNGTSNAMNRFRPFIGRIEFLDQIIPLQKCRVNFTLKAVNDYYFGNRDKFEIHIDFNTYELDLIGDKIFIWEGKHKDGDTYHGSFEIIPKKAGRSGFTIYMLPFKNIGLWAEYCIDEDGTLNYVDNPRQNRPKCETLKNLFINKNDLNHVISNLSPDRGDYFYYEIKLDTSIKMGDTAIIKYKLVALSDIEDGINM